MTVAGGVATQPLPPALVAQLREAALPEAAEAYWPACARLAALGWVDDALELLGLHSAWLRYDGGATAADEAARGAVGALEAATLLLRRFPVLSQQGVVHGAGREFSTPSELLAYRRTWQAQCGALLRDAALWRGCEAADKATAQGLRAVLAVLAGEEGALAAATASWLELLVASLLHVYPAAQAPAELRQLLHRCFDAGGGGAATEFLQAAAAVLEAAVDLDAQAVMRVCSSLCSDWFMAHAPDLLAAHPAGAPAGVVPRQGQGGAARLPLPAPRPRWILHRRCHLVTAQARRCWAGSCRTWAVARSSFTASSMRLRWRRTRPPGRSPPPTWPGAQRTGRRRWRHWPAGCRWTPAMPGPHARRLS